MPQAQTYQSEFTGLEMDARFAAVAQLTDALEALTAVVAQKYVKPASGIPSTDMDADVQAALAKANTAVQSLADYYTKSEVDQLLAAINGMDYVDVAALPTASADTLGKIYLVGPDASGYYAYYYTSYDGSAYSWVGPLGTTQISLAGYATKAELSQLDQKAGRQTFNNPYSITQKVDISANFTDAISGVMFYAGRTYNIRVTTPVLASYLKVILSDSANTEIMSKTIAAGSTSAVFSYTPATDTQIKVRLYTSARPTGVEAYIETEGMQKAIQSLPYIEKTLETPFIFKVGYFRLKVAGNMEAYNDYYVTMWKVSAGKKIKVSGGGGLTAGWALYAFYNSVNPSADSLVDSPVLSTGTADVLRGFIDVPAGASYFATSWHKDQTPPIVTTYEEPITGKSIYNAYDNIFAEKYIQNAILKSSSLTDLRYYFVRPGEVYRIASGKLSLNQGNIVGFYSAPEIIADNFLGNGLGFTTGQGYMEVDYLYTVPAGAVVMVVSCLKAAPPIIEKISGDEKNTIFDFNPAAQVMQKLLQMKYRSGRDTAIESNGMPNLCLCYFSDIHSDEVNAKRISDFYSRFKGIYRLGNYRALMDDALCGGDMLGSQFSDSYAWWTASGLSACLPTIGNHDAWVIPGQTVVGEQDCYEKFIEPYLSALNITQPEGAGENGYYPCYYYKDYSAANVRLIVLDCMHWGDTETTPGTQSAWLVATLAAAKTAGLAVVVMSHYPPALTIDETTTFTDALANLGSAILPTEITGLVQDFIDDGGEFVCWLAGHVHNDVFGKVTAYPDQICFVIDTASNKRDMAAMEDRVENTSTQDSFNIMAFDTNNKVVKVFRIGSDRDSYLRHKGVMCYDYATKTLIYND